MNCSILLFFDSDILISVCPRSHALRALVPFASSLRRKRSSRCVLENCSFEVYPLVCYVFSERQDCSLCSFDPWQLTIIGIEGTERRCSAVLTDCCFLLSYLTFLIRKTRGFSQTNHSSARNMNKEDQLRMSILCKTLCPSTSSLCHR